MKETIRNATGEPFSKWKPAEKFSWVIVTHCPGFALDMVHEHEFAIDRKFRFDFAWPDIKLAVEIDGFGYGHQAQQQMASDNEKANLAVELGWRVLRYNSRQLGSRAGVDEAVEQTTRVICGVDLTKHKGDL